MVYASVPPYLDPPNWNQQPQQQPTVTVQSQGLQSGGIGGFGVGGMGEASIQLPQTVSAMPPRSDGGIAGVVRPSSMAERARMAKVPQPEPAQKCPRCDSTNTKFCYFNNYSLSQPRHFCKTCRRYWTRGGALRNVPVGGGCRRNKRSKSSSSKGLATERPPGTSTSMALSVAGGMGVSSIMSSISPPAQMPFMGSFHSLSDYGNPSIGINYGGVQTIDPGHFQVGSSSIGTTALEQWRLQQIQQFPFFTGIEQPSPLPSSLGLYNFDNEGAVDTTPFAGQVHAKPSASGLISQLASVKMEESSQDQVNLRRQYLGMNSTNDHYWHTATSGSGTGGGGNSTCGGSGWTDLSGTFSSSSTGNLL